jgi:chemotaxis family two-component system response regulator Rcp1
VLLVEDNETDLFVIKEVLERSGLQVRLRVAKDGEDAVQYLKALAEDEKSLGPGLILLDLNLPRVPGIDVLRQIRRTAKCNQTPVIVVTSSVSASDRDAVQNLGVDAYFRKPPDLKAYMQLGQVIKQILSRSSGRTGNG